MIRSIIILLVFIPILLKSQEKDQSNAVCLTQQELRLYNLISSLRIENGQEMIPLSSSLTKVAQFHLNDLTENHPDTSICNHHSWSDKGNWVACCYNTYIPKPECMQNKPREITDYDHPGYEIIFWDSEKINPDSVMQIWSSVEASLQMFLQQDKWKKKRWEAIGLSLNDHYASVWFAEKPDHLPPPNLCGTERQLSKEELTKTSRISQPEEQYILTESNSYHIIFGSYSSRPEAIEVLKTYNKNFPEAGIIKGDNNYRISLDSYPSLQEAKQVRDGMGERYKKAWILKF